jgi:hypothetical protein
LCAFYSIPLNHNIFQTVVNITSKVLTLTQWRYWKFSLRTRIFIWYFNNYEYFFPT